MGLADFKARFFLFFAGKLREWANSIDEKVLSPPPQPARVVVEKRGSEPVTDTEPDDALGSEPSHPFTRVSTGPPQHWIDLVRERAPELLSLTPEYSPKEDPLREDHVHAYRSDIDDEVEIPDQTSVSVPKDKEDVTRKSGPVSLPLPKAIDRRNVRKLRRGKSSLPGSKPLTLKPLSEQNPYLQRPEQARDHRTEPARPSQLIGAFESEQKNQTTRERSSPGAVDKKDKVATRESTRQPGLQSPWPDRTSVNYETTKTATPMAAAAQAPGELNAPRKSEFQRPVFNVVKKPQSGPRRYLQAIVSVTRKTLRRAATGEVQSVRAITAVNLPGNPPAKHPSFTPDVVRFAEASKTRPPVRHEASQISVIPRRDRKAEPFAYQPSRAPETARHQASPPTRLHPKVPIENVKTASRVPSTVTFQSPVDRFANVSNPQIQDAFVNMPALMDEEKMNRASSVHLANLRPGKNQWPDLPSETSTEMADELATHQRDINRMRRLKQEQRGTPWNE